MKKILSLLVILSIGLFSCGKGSQKGIEVKGSDTLLELVQEMGEVYIKKSGIAVNVSGGGSGVGVAGIVNNNTDIGDASRQIKDKEIKKAKENGIEPLEVKLGIDAIAIVVNPSNTINQLTTDQLAAIYKGEVKNWKEVGGPDVEISLYGRQENSGTYAFFQEHILKANYSDKMKRMNGNAQMFEGVKADIGGIGYQGLGYVMNEDGSFKPGVKVLAVVGKSGRAVLPSDKSAVLSGEYAISRFLYQYVNKNMTQTVKDFVLFELSPEGQAIVKKTGFYPLDERAKELNPELFK
ncbi:MAG TPA: phosphate-binding protein [Spirochaetia bacterium]|nr:MAG: hypothetical protein A2Y41_12325 [Spirochaetes bacterium GWB1_36_13]HCL56534.1 phosphate-binding protein [Spirochaetia bacterium]